MRFPSYSKVGDHLFVKDQTADRTCWEETQGKVEGWAGADSEDEPGDVAMGNMKGSDVGVRGWCDCWIFPIHYSSFLPLIGVPPRWE